MRQLTLTLSDSHRKYVATPPQKKKNQYITTSEMCWRVGVSGGGGGRNNGTRFVPLSVSLLVDSVLYWLWGGCIMYFENKHSNL